MQMVTHGVYRKTGKSLCSGHVKPNPKMRLNTRSRGILKLGGVGGGKALVWHTIEGEWCGAAAASAYSDTVLPALATPEVERAYCTLCQCNQPHRRHCQHYTVTGPCTARPVRAMYCHDTLCTRPLNFRCGLFHPPPNRPLLPHQIKPAWGTGDGQKFASKYVQTYV